MDVEVYSMHYSEIDNLVPVILAVQEDDNDAITLLLEGFAKHTYQY